MQLNLLKKVTSLEQCIRLQRNSLEQGYMHGMLNGLICAHSIITGGNPHYACVPHKKNKIRYKKNKKD